MNDSLKGKKGLIVGIANDKSIAYGCARAFKEAGADLAITFLNDKAEKFVRPLAESLSVDIVLPLDIEVDHQLDNLFSELDKEWGSLDFILHSIAFAPINDLHGRVIDSSREGFLKAVDVSCHSLIRLAKYAETRMVNGGSILTMSYEGANHVAPNYGIMGMAKAALESATRALSYELGSKNINVNAISPGPIATRAASGITGFDDLMADSIVKSPLHRLVTTEEVGALATLLVSELGRGINGDVITIDAGRHIIY